MKPPVVVNKSLEVRLWAKFRQDALKWCAIHVALLGLLVYDVSKKCKYVDSKLYWVEYGAIGVVGCSLLYYIIQYLYYNVMWEPVVGTEEQKRLLQFEDKDDSFVVKNRDSPRLHANHNPAMNFSNLSFNDSHNISGYSNQSLHFNRSLNMSNYSSAIHTKSQSTFSSPYSAVNADNDLFVEPASLANLLEEASYQDQKGEEEVASSMNNMTSFWTHKIDDYAGLLRTSKYQMSPTMNNTKPTNPILDDCVFFVSNASAKSSDKVLDSSRVSSAKLSHCVTNLKGWISATVVDRVVQEIATIDKSFKAKGLGDMQIGHVGLERLKKTTENHLVTSNIPTLPLLVPFLDLTPNQEFLVKRIKELAKGSCLAEFKHAANPRASVGIYDEHLPTDAAIIFHLFCTYVDMQLLPLPQPGGRPFYDRYVIVSDKKSPSELIADVKNKAKCAILVSNSLKPVFHFVCANEINHSPDRNNLFHVITQFLFYIKAEHGGFLENVNLDKSGLNILCILD